MNVLHIISTVDTRIEVNHALKTLYENNKYSESFETLEYCENIKHMRNLEDLNKVILRLSSKAIIFLREKNIQPDWVADRKISYLAGRFLDESVISLTVVFMRIDP